MRLLLVQGCLIELLETHQLQSYAIEKVLAETIDDPDMKQVQVNWGNIDINANDNNQDFKELEARFDANKKHFPTHCYEATPEFIAVMEGNNEEQKKALWKEKIRL